MRTTIEISEELLRQAKKRAADQGVPLMEVIEKENKTFQKKLREIRKNWKST